MLHIALVKAVKLTVATPLCTLHLGYHEVRSSAPTNSLHELHSLLSSYTDNYNYTITQNNLKTLTGIQQPRYHLLTL